MQKAVPKGAAFLVTSDERRDAVCPLGLWGMGGGSGRGPRAQTGRMGGGMVAARPNTDGEDTERGRKAGTMFGLARGTGGREDRGMKAMARSLLLGAGVAMAFACGESFGEVVARARSPEGAFAEFRVVLDAEGEGVAVANFVGLVDGTRKWVDPESGRVRGGAEDAFYRGMVFDLADVDCVRGGLRAIPDGEGGTKYEGVPGYFVAGRKAEAWTEAGDGTLALAENDGPHSGSGELALYATNAVTPWPVLGRVPGEDMGGARELAALVRGGATVAVEWEVDASRATAGELAALEAGRELVPEAFGLESGLAENGAGVAFVWPGSSRLLLYTSEDLTGGFAKVGDGWRTVEDAGAERLAWEALNLTGNRGFVTLAGATQPQWGGHRFTGKWWMGLDYADHREEIWWDFGDGTGTGTGLVAMVEGGEVTGVAKFSQATSWRETGNSIVAYYGRGFIGHYHYLGFAEEGASAGRFMYKQTYLIDEVGRTWGTFEMEEGWAREPGVAGGRSGGGKKSARGKLSYPEEGGRAARAPTEEGERAALAPAGEGGMLHSTEPGSGRGMALRRVRGGERRAGGGTRTADWRSWSEEELEIGVLGEGDARAEEADAFFDLGEEGVRAGESGAAEGIGDGGIEGGGLVEPAIESECDGEGVADDGVVRGEGMGAAGDGENPGGVGG